MLQAIIFDMDGVLVESTTYIEQSFQKVFLEKYGVDISSADHKKYLGRPLKDQLPMYAHDFGIDIDMSVQEFSTRAFAHELALYEKSLLPNTAILAFIQQLKTQGIKIAVATSSTRTRAETILQKLEIFDQLDAFVTVEDIVRGKPAPDIFLEAATRLSIDPRHCVVIEDAVNGMQAARAADMIALGKITSHHTGDELLHAGASMTFTSFAELHIDTVQDLLL